MRNQGQAVEETLDGECKVLGLVRCLDLGFGVFRLLENAGFPAKLPKLEGKIGRVNA